MSKNYWTGIRKNLQGQVFGDLTVVEFAGRDADGKAKWKCVCSCVDANEIIVFGYNLSNGHTTSCGHKVTKHRMRWTPEYMAWNAMLNRCYGKNSGAYKNYGAKGIEVCARWRESFENFFDDMGHKPSAEHSLDRIDPKIKLYGPGLCRWATLLEQQRNRSSVKLTNIDVMQMRWLVGDGGYTQTEVANLWSITSSHISNIINHKVWKTYE